MKRAFLVISLILLGSLWGVRKRSASAEAAGSAAAESDVAWTPFRDPAEHAFTMDVPQGWKIVGGAYRFGRLDPRVMVEMESPDGQTDLRFSDANVPPFTTLNPTFLKLGWQEGRPYNLHGVAREIVANYRSGWVLADLYGQARFSSGCSQLHLKQMRQLPAIHEEFQVETTAGDVLYTCDNALEPMAAYVFAETQLFQAKVAGTWMVTWLYSFIAPQDQAVQAMQTILHATCSFEINPEWERTQRRAAGDNENWFRERHEKERAQAQARIRQQCTQFPSEADAFRHALEGPDLTSNPVDGKPREVWAGTSGTRWINPVGEEPSPPASTGPLAHVLDRQP
ncbi:MAG: hypothetical protein ACLQVL_34995 [Terriglobia bacterium]